MNLDMIVKLIDAGYTKDEINAMMQPSAPEGQKEETGTGSAPDPAEKSVPEGQPESESDISALTKQVAQLTSAVSAMQSEAARKATGGKAEPETAESVVSAFFGKPKEKGV